MRPIQHISRYTKTFAKRHLSKYGLELRRVSTSASCPESKEELSFARPPGDWLSIGPRENYYIRTPYTSRRSVEYLDERSGTDTYQREVYLLVRELASEYGLKSVLDIGCGGGYKLVNYLGHLDIVGTEVSETVTWLKDRYPEREWQISDFSATLPKRFDFILAADVIEHLPDPTMILDFVSRQDFQFLIISTPERNLLKNSGSRTGPPTNPNHIREWTLAEFNRFTSDYFDIVYHYVSNPQQATQCAVAIRRGTQMPQKFARPASN